MTLSKHHIAGYVSALLFSLCLIFPRFFAFGPALWSCAMAWIYYKSYRAEARNTLRDLQKKYRPALFLLTYFLIWIWSSCTWSIAPEASLERAAKVTLLGIANLSVFVTIPLTFPHLKINYNKSLRFCFLFIGLFSFIFYMERMLKFPIHEFIYDQPADYRAKFNRQVVCIISALLPLCFATLKLAGIEDKTKQYMKLCGILTGFLVIFSYSQAAQLILLLTLCSLFLFPYKQAFSWISLRFILMFFTLLMPFISMYLYSQFTTEEIKAFLLLAHAGVEDRLEIWTFISEAIFDNPSFGYGFGTTRYIEFNAPHINWKSSSVLHPHNIPMQLWLELGLPILLLFCGIISIIMRNIKELTTDKVDCLILASFLGWLAVAFTSYGAWQSWFIGFTVFLPAFWISLQTHNKLMRQS